MPALAFPQSEVNDPDAVADALDSGLLHWVKGETVDALNCLRQAREAADDAGQDQRALDLARAAAELTQQDTSTPMSSPAASDAQPSEPRRSRLPEPPAPSKKYATTGATEGSAGATAVAPTGAAHGTHTPSASKTSTKSPMTSSAPLSGRPAPPSTRPLASPSVAPSAGHLGLRGAATHLAVATSPHPSTAPTTKTEPGTTEPGKTEPVKTEPVKTEPAGLSHGAAWTPRAKSPSAATSSASAEPESRASSRPDAADHRLASLRVRVERIDPDGTVRVKLLDLAATASGEDNALLIVPQGVWQELKRHS